MVSNTSPPAAMGLLPNNNDSPPGGGPLSPSDLFPLKLSPLPFAGRVLCAKQRTTHSTRILSSDSHDEPASFFLLVPRFPNAVVQEKLRVSSRVAQGWGLNPDLNAGLAQFLSIP